MRTMDDQAIAEGLEAYSRACEALVNFYQRACTGTGTLEEVQRFNQAFEAFQEQTGVRKLTRPA